jgi:5-hydroxyisourate hydrolase-like protein (transthyretin family)
MAGRRAPRLARRLFVATLLLGAGPLHAQNFPVSGHVVDAATGQPVARATVALVPIDASDEQSAPDEASNRRGRGGFARPMVTPALAADTTGGDGEFVFPAVPAGRYRLSAARRGYNSAALDEHGSLYAAVVVGTGAPATGLRFPLQPQGSIEGTLSDSSGDPVQVATVTLFRRSTDGTGTILPFRSTFVQQDDSAYSFGDLPAGTYFVGVTGRPWFAENRQPATPDAAPNPLDVVYPLTFYGGALSSSGAQPVELSPGELVHADISLQAMPAVYVHVSNGTGTEGFGPPDLTESAFGAAVNVPVWQIDVRPGPAGEATQSFALAPGAYTLHRDGSSESFNASAGTILPPVVSAAAPVQLSGRVALEDGRALPAGAQLTLTPNRGAGLSGGYAGSERGDTLRVGRTRFGGFREMGGFRERAIDLPLGADGSFQAGTLQPGDYALGVSAPAPARLLLTGAAAGGAQVSGDFLLHVGAQNAMLAATVAEANGSIRGVVVDAQGHPEAGVLVLLVPPDGSLPSFYREDESNTDGSFAIQGLPTGRYRVVALRNGWDLAWRTPSALAPYLRLGVSVLLTPSDNLVLPAPVPAQDR